MALAQPTVMEKLTPLRRRRTSRYVRASICLLENQGLCAANELLLCAQTCKRCVRDFMI